MDDKLVHKFINKVKDKFTKKKPTYPSFSEYAFSTEEIENINKQNKQKIQDLKQDIFTKKKDNNKKTSEVLNKLTTPPTTTDEKDEKPIVTIENPNKPQETTIKDNLETKDEELINEKPETIIEEKVDKTEEEPQTKNSFINLSKEHQKLVSDKWNEIRLNQIDKDIIDGKDLLNHNYTITYADEAAKFIHYIRKEYEVVICYLIGFNNEKQGIYDKTIFSSKIDDEWKHLNSYIKILEKIRNFKK